MEKPKITMKVELETDKAVKKIEEIAEKMKELNIPNSKQRKKARLY